MPRTFARTPNSQEEYIKNLDPLLKKKRQSGFAFGEDVNPAVFRLPGMGVNPQQLAGGGDVATTYSPSFALQQLPAVPAVETPLPEDTTLSEQDIIDIINSVNEDIGQEPIESGTPEAISETSDGGYLYSDGIIRYPDGTERIPLDENAYPVATLEDGSILYSDNSTKQAAATPVANTPEGFTIYSDNSIRLGDKVFTGTDFVSFSDFDSYLKTISGGALGEQNVTGEYGANYGFSTEGTNIGLDVANGTGAKIYTPAPATIVSVNRFPYQIDPNTGQVVGDAGVSYGNNDLYGNSVLLQLNTGDYLRFSHLSNEQLADLQEGQYIPEGSYLGLMGDTGNTTGQHLDQEYISTNGQMGSIRTFVNRVVNDAAYRNSLGYGEGGFSNSDIVQSISGGKIVGMIDPTTGAPMSTDAAGFVKAKRKEISDKSSSQEQPQQPEQPAPTAPMTQDPMMYVNQEQPVKQNIPATTGDPSQLMIEQAPAGKTPGTVDLNVTENIEKLTGIAPVGEGKINIQTPFGTVNAPEYNVTGNLSSFVQNALDKVGQTIQEATSVTPVYAQGKNTQDYRDKTSMKQASGMSDLPTPSANTAAFSPVRPTGNTVGQVSTQQGEVLGSKEARIMSPQAQENIGVDSMSPANQIAPTVPQKSELETRLDTMASQGKTSGTSKKAAKLQRRLDEIKSKYGVGGTSQATSTGYVNPLSEAKAKIENSVKSAYYDSGINKGSFDKFLGSIGRAGDSIVDNASSLVQKIGEKAQKGVQDTRFTLNKAADKGYFSPGSGAYKVLQVGEKLQQGAKNVKNQAVAAGQILSGDAQPELSSFIAPLLSRDAVKNLSTFERKLKDKLKFFRK